MLPYIYEDILATNFDSVTVDSHGRISGQLAVGHIVFPAVPRTYDDLAFHFAFAQRAAPVQAYVIDCKELTFDVGYCDVFAVQLEFANRAGRDFVFLSLSAKMPSNGVLRANQARDDEFDMLPVPAVLALILVQVTARPLRRA